MEGLRDEIALLRSSLKKTVDAEGEEALKAREELRAVTDGVDTLMRAVGTQQRMAPRAGGDLGENITAVLNQLGDQLLPADR